MVMKKCKRPGSDFLDKKKAFFRNKEIQNQKVFLFAFVFFVKTYVFSFRKPRFREPKDGYSPASTVPLEPAFDYFPVFLTTFPNFSRLKEPKIQLH